MTRPLWTPHELAGIFGPPTVAMKGAAAGVSIDTRTLKPGDLFVAIKGDTHDGHDHVARAFEAGASASAALVARNVGGGPLFVVEDTLRGMERLGVAARARSGARVLAITGSVGKTSAKEMARTALSAVGPTHASAASFNNHWGVPLTLARLPGDAAYGVFEIGMNHAGEITPLVGFVRPHVAMVTTIGPVHIEHFGSLEAIADAKAEIFSGIEPGGAAVLNRDAPQYERLAEKARARGRVATFGASAGGDARLMVCEAEGEGSRLVAEIAGRRLAFHLGAPGRHMAENAVGVLLACYLLGAPLDACAEALAAFAPAKGRGERFTLTAPDGPFVLIDESYNANPLSMRAALGLLGAATPGPGGRRIAVIGDMLELGAQGAALHAGLARDLEAQNVDLLFGAGPLTRALYDAAPAALRAAHAGRAEDLREALLGALHAGDVVMIKGSNGSRMGPLAAALREHFAPATSGSGLAAC